MVSETFDCEPQELAPAPTEKNFLVKDPNRKPGEPEYLVLRMDRVIPSKSQSMLYSSFQRFMATKPKTFGKQVREEARSDPNHSIFFHVGTWSKCSPKMMLTSDTVSQSAESSAALAKLLQKLQEEAIPRLKKCLANFIPTHFYNTEQ